MDEIKIDTINKVMRFQIIDSEGIDFKDFKKQLVEFQDQTQKVLNKTIRLNWEWNNYCSDYYIKHECKPDILSILGYKSFSGYCDKVIRTEYPMLSKANISTSIQRGCKKWNDSKKKFLKGEMSIPSYKNSIIDLHSKSIEVIENENKYYVDLRLFARNEGSCHVCVEIKVDGNYQKKIIESVLSGEYKIGASMIIFSKNKWFINLTYCMEKKELLLSDKNIMGIDMGIVNAAYMAFNNNLKRYHIRGGEIDSFRKKQESLLKSLQSSIKSDAIKGRGYKHRSKYVRVVRKKIANFKDLINHKYSKYIVGLAVKNNCKIIQMEDLSNIKKDKLFLKDWSYFDLQEKIKYKADEVGIEVKLINPRYTSQKCSGCGHTDKDNRVKRDEFVCVNCGVKLDADYNAAKNISNPDNQEIIKKKLKKNKK